MKRLIYRVYTFLKDHTSACQFFDEFGIFIQFILALICLSALLLKRFLEKPRRPWSIWFLDTVKQCLGQFSQHFANLLIADKLGQGSGLECEWYLNNLMADCTIGVLISYFYLTILLIILSGTKLDFKTGDYGQGEVCEEDSVINWKINLFMYQIMWWVLIVLLAKFSTLGIIFCFYHVVENAGKLILLPFKHDPKIKLIFVMIIFPTIFNIIQFWFTDNFIKNSKLVSDTEKSHNIAIKDKDPCESILNFSYLNNQNNQISTPTLNQECIIRLDYKDEMEIQKVKQQKEKNKDSDYQQLPTSDHNV